MNLYRAQIILEKQQHERLAQIASEEGKSLSEVARELIHFALRERQRARWNWRLKSCWMITATTWT